MATTKASNVGKAGKAGMPGNAGSLRVTWTRSAIGRRADQRGTLRSLGLRRLGQAREVADTPANRGRIEKIKHLIRVEDAAEG